jgi:hypothetical protein
MCHHRDMPVVLRTASDTRTLTEQAYVNEAELQDVVAQHPELVMGDEETAIAFVAREFALPSGAGRLDLLLVDARGRPTAVEIKLLRNGESRREVLAQVFDYASALAEYRVTELDQATGGALDGAFRKLLSDADDEAAFESLWLACDAALKSGAPRVVVVIDSAPDELIRIVRFVNEHSDLDVRLVQVAKFVADGETIFVPTLLVRGVDEPSSRARVARVPRPELRETLAAFHPPDGISVGGRAQHYRHVKVHDWPSSLHYEFLCVAGSVQPELHVESRELMRLAPSIEALADRLRKALPGVEVTWVTPWLRVGGRLRLSHPDGLPPSEAARVMAKLIELTRPTLDRALRTAPAKLATLDSPAKTPV